MSTARYPSEEAIDQALAAAAGPVTSAEPPPAAVLEWLARLRLLEGVPFAYLVPDERLLPPESIRLFHLDRNWADAAVDGALSVGAGTTRERAHLRARHQTIRAAVDAAERNVWAAAAHPDTTYGPAAAETVTGFLLRSRAVSGWPGLHVCADRDSVPVRLLRVERLAPAVLLALLDGLPTTVTIEEPRQGLQFGFDATTGGGRVIPTRDPATGQASGNSIPAKFRPGAPGVLDVRQLLIDLGAGPAAAGSAGLAFQLVQYPYRQDFTGPPSTPPFTSTITLGDLDAAFKEPS